MVAIKVVSGQAHADDKAGVSMEKRQQRMAQLEGLLMSVMDHPNIVTTYRVTSRAVNTHLMEEDVAPASDEDELDMVVTAVRRRMERMGPSLLTLHDGCH